MDAVTRAQLAALQAQCGAMQAFIASMLGEDEPPVPQGCQHLETENVGTFGAAEIRCKACGAVVNGA